MHPVIPLPRRSGLPVPSSVDPNDGIRRDTNARATRLILRVCVCPYLFALVVFIRCTAPCRLSVCPIDTAKGLIQRCSARSAGVFAPSTPRP